jgi:hypothetical protein
VTDASFRRRQRCRRDVEAAVGVQLGKAEVAVLVVRARLQDDHVESGPREDGRSDTAAGARADHAHVALELRVAIDAEWSDPPFAAL